MIKTATKNLKTLLIIGLIALAAGVLTGVARADDRSMSRSIAQIARQQLAVIYPKAEIQVFPDSIQWLDGTAPTQLGSIRITDENGRGQARFSVISPAGIIAGSEGEVSFSARIKAIVPNRRFLPGERLDPAELSMQSIDISRGVAHEYRGLMLSADAKLGELQARNTLLEGQPVLTTAVERTPDGKRGDLVKIKLISGEIVLYSQGTLDEPAYLNTNVRVLSQKTKRLMSGVYSTPGLVEVTL